MSGRRLVVLGYHRIGPPPPGGWNTWFFISSTRFDAHLRLLRERGWSLLDAEAFRAALAAPESLPERSVLLTFDDGYRSMVHHALPCLRRHAAPAVLFVPSDYVGRRNDFDPGEPQEDICGWDDLRLLERHGVSVQSHGASHRAFSCLPVDEQHTELERSKRELERGLGTDVRLFAYPYGYQSAPPEQAEGSLGALGYEAAFLYPGGPVALPVRNPFRIERVALGPDTDLGRVLHSGAA